MRPQTKPSDSPSRWREVGAHVSGFKPFEAFLGWASDALADLFGDNLIGEHDFIIPAEVFQDWTSEEIETDEGEIRYPRLDKSFKEGARPPNSQLQINWPKANNEPLFNEGGATYKVYFQIIPTELKRPLVPNLE